MGANSREFTRTRELEQSDDFIDVEQIEVWQESMIESLLKTSNIDHSEREEIERKSSSLTVDEANETIRYLNENQLNPLTSGFNYSQTDINKFK
jgi:hypothetical protein